MKICNNSSVKGLWPISLFASILPLLVQLIPTNKQLGENILKGRHCQADPSMTFAGFKCSRCRKSHFQNLIVRVNFKVKESGYWSRGSELLSKIGFQKKINSLAVKMWISRLFSFIIIAFRLICAAFMFCSAWADWQETKITPYSVVSVVIKLMLTRLHKMNADVENGGFVCKHTFKFNLSPSSVVMS